MLIDNILHNNRKAQPLDATRRKKIVTKLYIAFSTDEVEKKTITFLQFSITNSNFNFFKAYSFPHVLGKLELF